LARALELLDQLQREGAARVDSLAQLQGVHKTTTLRLLQTLERYGYVTRGQDRGEFRLGLKLYELGFTVGERLGLLTSARPIMRELALATGETIDLAVCEGDSMVLIESIAARASGPVGTRVGQRVPATCTTAGKNYLASLSADTIERILPPRDLPRLGPKSIVQRERLLAELDQVRARDYATNDEESDAGLRFVGVPIHISGSPNALTLILGAPQRRLPRRDFPYVADLLRPAGERIASEIASYAIA
jgi:DNA-binding IclR family transcriptional regulator